MGISGFIVLCLLVVQVYGEGEYKQTPFGLVHKDCIIEVPSGQFSFIHISFHTILLPYICFNLLCFKVHMLRKGTLMVLHTHTRCIIKITK